MIGFIKVGSSNIKHCMECWTDEAAKFNPALPSHSGSRAQIATVTKLSSAACSDKQSAGLY